MLPPMKELVNRLAADPMEQPGFFLGLVQREVLWPDVTAPAPGLLAALDQHGAAVRDAIGPGAGWLALEDLAAYARGVVEVAAEYACHDMPAQTQHWLSLRLASVCGLASDLGYLPSVTAV